MIWSPPDGSDLNAVGVAAEGTELVFTTLSSTLQDRAIWRCTLPGCSSVEKVKGGLGAPGQIVRRGNSLVWGNDSFLSDSGIYSCDYFFGVTSCTPFPVISEVKPAGLSWQLDSLAYAIFDGNNSPLRVCNSLTECASASDLLSVLDDKITGIAYPQGASNFSTFLSTRDGSILGVSGTSYETRANTTGDTILNLVAYQNSFFFATPVEVFRCSSFDDCTTPISVAAPGGNLAVSGDFLYVANNNPPPAPQILRYSLK